MEEPNIGSNKQYGNHGGARHGHEHKLDIGDTVRMQAAVPGSAYGGLQDMPSPSGRLSDRIERLRQRCTEALGRDAFRDAYNFLKQHEEVRIAHETFRMDVPVLDALRGAYIRKVRAVRTGWFGSADLS
jgi:hypothetical protein